MAFFVPVPLPAVSRKRQKGVWVVSWEEGEAEAGVAVSAQWVSSAVPIMMTSRANKIGQVKRKSFIVLEGKTKKPATSHFERWPAVNSGLSVCYFRWAAGRVFTGYSTPGYLSPLCIAPDSIFTRPVRFVYSAAAAQNLIEHQVKNLGCGPGLTGFAGSRSRWSCRPLAIFHRSPFYI